MGKFRSQEQVLVRIFSDSSARTRLYGFVKLREWLRLRSESTLKEWQIDYESMVRIWDALFYCMWQTDKPLAQENCAERMADLVTFSPNAVHSLIFFRAFLAVMLDKFPEIDKYRVDKFLMLIRRMLRAIFKVMAENNWSGELCDRFAETLRTTVHDHARVERCQAVPIFVAEIFIEELAKVTNGQLVGRTVSELLRSFVEFLCKSLRTKAQIVCQQIEVHLFDALIQQSDAGLIFEKRFRLWKQNNFVTGSIDCVEFEADTETMETEQEPAESGDEASETVATKKIEDPRAGHVDVELAQIQFDTDRIVELFEEYQPKNRTVASRVRDKFLKLKRNVYPLGLKKVTLPTDSDVEANVTKAAKRLLSFEENILNETKQSKPNGSKRPKYCKN